MNIIEENKKGILSKEKSQKVKKSDLDDNFTKALEEEQVRVQRGLTDSDWKKEANDRTTKEEFFLQSLWQNKEQLLLPQPPKDVETQFYYYRRWIWMQFPYACESHIRNFSKTMKFCYQSPTEYMTIKDEEGYAERALEVVITAV